MIISRTPFRVSFAGGGTDLPEFYKEEEGAVLSTTINKYMYITVNDRFDESFRLSYSKTEICDSIDKIEHRIFRHVLKKYAPQGRGLEIKTMADIPSGTGLGSSSSFTVGLLNALKAHNGFFQSADELSAEASRIEIEDLGEPIGKQDQYAAGFGGFQFFRFLPNGQVSVEPVICGDKIIRDLESSLLMFYTGVTRDAASVLNEQKRNTSSGDKMDYLKKMRDLAFRMRITLQSGHELSEFGNLLHEGWELKKNMATGISNAMIDEWYNRGIKHGAWGGKILGAGGGGFLMLMAPPRRHEAIARELKELRLIPIRFESFGSRIIFVG